MMKIEPNTGDHRDGPGLLINACTYLVHVVLH
jgi:hypothetical protein